MYVYMHTYIYIYIYIYIGHSPMLCKDACGGFYFVCDHGKHGNAKQCYFGCNLWLRRQTQKLRPKLHLATKTLTT